MPTPPPLTNNGGVNSIVAILAGLDDGGTPPAPLFTAAIGPDPQDLADHLKDYPRAVVRPLNWTQSDAWDPTELVELVRFEVEVTTFPLPTDDADGVIDQLVEAVKTAVNHADLGPGCVPAASAIDEGKYTVQGFGSTRIDTAPGPGERRAWLRGRFAYIQGGGPS